MGSVCYPNTSCAWQLAFGSAIYVLARDVISESQLVFFVIFLRVPIYSGNIDRHLYKHAILWQRLHMRCKVYDLRAGVGTHLWLCLLATMCGSKCFVSLPEQTVREQQLLAGKGKLPATKPRELRSMPPSHFQMHKHFVAWCLCAKCPIFCLLQVAKRSCWKR